MEAKDFENNIKERFAQHGASTPESVWDAIAGDLDRKRRIVGFWWWNALSAVCILILATSFYWNMDQGPIGRTKQFPTHVTKTAPEKNAPLQDDQQGLTTVSTENEITATSTIQTPQTPQNGNAPANHLPKRRPNNNNLSEQPTNGPALQLPNQRLAEIAAVLPSTVSTNNSDSTDAKLSLPTRDIVQLPTNNNGLIKTSAYAIFMPKFGHTIGLQMSTFANVSEPRIVSNTALYASFENFSNAPARYHKYIELMPYYQLDFRGKKSHIRLLSVLSMANASKPEGTYPWSRRQLSFGGGLGYAYSFHFNNGLNLNVYGASHWEKNIGHFSLPVKNQLVDSTTTDPNLIASSSVPLKYVQNLLAIEVGAELHYALTEKTALYGSLGYRNYFWQQHVSTTEIITIPQLMKFSIGISRRL